MPTPIHRYSLASAGVKDAAHFVFAHGTNPEVVAIVECREATADAPEWFFALVPATTAAIVAKLDGVTIWTT